MTKTSPKTPTAKPTSRKPNNRRSISSQKVDELKLGKFLDFEPLHLPEREPRRGWQIFWAIVLLAIAVYFLVCIVVMAPGLLETDFGWWLSLWGNWQNWPYVLAEVLLLIALFLIPILCLIIGGLLLARQRIVAVLWYVLIVTVWSGLFNWSLLILKERVIERCALACPNASWNILIALVFNLIFAFVAVKLIKIAHRYSKHRRKK